LVKEGNGETLISVEFPLPIIIAAETYLDKYGPGERYNILRFFDRITVPLLFVFGAGELEEAGPAFADLPSAIRSSRRSDQAVEVVAITDADHFYRDKQAQLAARILQWLAQ
jgi:alpha/beta superfamily hydrolase